MGEQAQLLWAGLTTTHTNMSTSVDGKLAIAECSLARKKAECEILLAERKELMGKLEAYLSDGASSQQSLSDANAEIKRLKAQLASLEGRLERITRDRNHGDEAAAHCERMIDSLEKRNKDLEDELARLREQFKHLEQQNARLKSDLAGAGGASDEKDRLIAELQAQLRKVTAEKDSLLKAQLAVAQHALDNVSIGPQPYDLYRKEYAGDYLMRHKNEFYTAYKRL